MCGARGGGAVFPIHVCLCVCVKAPIYIHICVYVCVFVFFFFVRGGGKEGKKRGKKIDVTPSLYEKKKKEFSAKSSHYLF